MIINNDDYNMSRTLNKLDSFTIYREGKEEKFLNSDSRFFAIRDKLSELFESARVMPSLGVSLHNLTVEEMKHGDWIRLDFNEEQTVNELPFTALIFKLENGFGVNLIREFEDLYEGRCIYLDFDNEQNLTDLLNV